MGEYTITVVYDDDSGIVGPVEEYDTSEAFYFMFKYMHEADCTRSDVLEIMDELLRTGKCEIKGADCQIYVELE